MAIYLNTNQSLQNYKRLFNSEYFVDKSYIINKLNKLKEYVQKFKSENSSVLAVAISYDSKTKEHSCKIEELCK